MKFGPIDRPTGASVQPTAAQSTTAPTPMRGGQASVGIDINVSLPPGNAVRGERVFNSAQPLDDGRPAGCAGCHVAGAGSVAPDIKGVATRAEIRKSGMSAEKYLHESIVQPNAFVAEGFTAGIMPQDFGQRMSTQDLADVIAYLLTLNRPLAARPLAERNNAFSTPPPMMIDPNKSYTATIATEVGDIVIKLFPDKAPKTVNSFVFLARQGFYDGVTFHRVLEGFMAQGGDPTGTGTGGPGYEFENENPDAKFDKGGQLAIANAGKNTNGSQFFITFGPTQLSGADYTIFGEVVQGIDVLSRIKRSDPNQNPTFTGTMIYWMDVIERL